MKKFFLCALLCTMAGVSKVSAQTLMRSVFYGEKARDSAVNPCKGACVRKCGEIDASYVDPSFNDDPATINPYSLDGSQTTDVRITVKDAEGNVISERIETYPGDVASVKEALREGAISNGGEIEE